MRVSAGHHWRPSAGPPAPARWGLRGAVAALGVLAVHTLVNARLLRRASTVSPPVRPVSVLVPARNEAERIGACLRAVLTSDWPDLEVLVLDDESADGTADVVRQVTGADPRVRLLRGDPTPPGWLGKPWACAQLARAAAGEILVFVDADVVLGPAAIGAAVALVDDGLDLACPYPRQVAEGPLPRLIQPLLQWSWLTFLPLRIAERSARPSLTAANGQMMACTAATYAKAGGHTAVRDRVLEDIALARACKRAGLRAGVADGTTLASCRMYGSAGELVAGYTKSLWSAFDSPAGAAGVGALLWWLYVHPVMSLLGALRRGDRATARVAALGYGLALAGRAVAAGRTGGRRRDALAHPASIVTLLWMSTRSVVGRRRGTLEWRGRPVTTHAQGRRRQGSGMTSWSASGRSQAMNWRSAGGRLRP